MLGFERPAEAGPRTDVGEVEKSIGFLGSRLGSNTIESHVVNVLTSKYLTTSKIPLNPPFAKGEGGLEWIIPWLWHRTLIMLLSIVFEPSREPKNPIDFSTSPTSVRGPACLCVSARRQASAGRSKPNSAKLLYKISISLMGRMIQIKSCFLSKRSNKKL